MKTVYAVLFATLIAAVLIVGHSPVSAEEAAASEETVALYVKRCALCHSDNGEAKKMAEGSANLNDAEWQKTTSVDAIVTVIADGAGKMPGYSKKMSADEIKAVATYVLQLK